jgi:hypothetical protein
MNCPIQDNGFSVLQDAAQIILVLGKGGLGRMLP